MLKAVLLIARHELLVLMRSKRAIGIALLYLGSAALGSLGYVLALRGMRDTATLELTKAGITDQTDAALSTLGEKAYEGILSFVAGAPIESLAEALRSSLIMPVLLWAALIFLPFVVLLTSFDQMTYELGSRAILFSTLRVPRWALVIGKLLAHTAAFMLLATLSALMLLALAGAMVDGVHFFSELPGLFYVLALLLPFGLTYLGLASFASTLHRQPFVTLLAALALSVALRALSWFRYIPEESNLALLRVVRFLSPASYHDGLWLAEAAGPLGSGAAYVGFGAFFVALALWRLEGRDL